MEDFYNDGYNEGYGRSRRNDHHDPPQSDGDRHSFDQGREEGERHRRVAEEIDREIEHERRNENPGSGNGPSR